LRLAASLAEQPDARVRVVLIGEGATCAHAHRKVPQGHSNVEVMLKDRGEIGV
jgi:hypothetical protein